MENSFDPENSEVNGMRKPHPGVTLLFFASIIVSIMAGFGVCYVLIETFKPSPQFGDHLMGYIFQLADYFPSKPKPVNIWDLSMTVPFSIAWVLNKAAIIISVVVVLIAVFVLLAPFYVTAAVLINLFWKYYFKSRLSGSSIPQTSRNS